MKYRIAMEGGFTGIGKVYEGQIQVDKEHFEALLAAMSKKGEAAGKVIPDVITYRFRLEQDQQLVKAVFTDRDIPGILRQFIDDVRAGEHPPGHEGI